MTATLDHAELALAPTVVVSSSDALLSVLQDTLSHCAERDPDELSSHSVPGGVLVALAGVARTAAGLLGTPSGVPLAHGPGVVVVRDLLAATRVLARAAARGGAAPQAAALVPVARALHVTFVEALTPAA